MGYIDADGAWIYEETDLADEGVGFSEVLNRASRAVPGMVQRRMTQELADDDSLRAGALALVKDAVKGQDIVLATDPEVFAQVDDDDWAVLFEAPAPSGPVVALGVDNQGNTRGRFMSAIPGPFADVSAIEVWNSVHEWWTNNVVNRVKVASGPEDRGTGVSGEGDIVAWDHPKRGTSKSRVIGQAGASGPGGDVDDHDAPSRWTAPDGSWGFAAWNNHGDTDYHSYKITTDGTVDGFNGAQIDAVVSPGAAVSYQQLFLKGQVGDTWTFWNLCRTGPGWPIVETAINPKAGTVVVSPVLRRILTINGQQTYAHAVQVGRKLRIVAYVNPKENVHAIWLLVLDMDTGMLTSPCDPRLNRDVAATGYTDLAGVTPLVAETANTRSSRRMFEASPVADAVGYAEWERVDPSGGYYYVATRDAAGNVTTVQVPGGPTGPRIGYTADSNYVGGLSFSPSGKVATIHHDRFGGSVLRVWDGTTSRIVAYSRRRMVRPVWIGETEILVGDVVHYTDYFDFHIHQRSVRV